MVSPTNQRITDIANWTTIPLQDIAYAEPETRPTTEDVGVARGQPVGKIKSTVCHPLRDEVCKALNTYAKIKQETCKGWFEPVCNLRLCEPICDVACKVLRKKFPSMGQEMCKSACELACHHVPYMPDDPSDKPNCICGPLGEIVCKALKDLNIGVNQETCAQIIKDLCMGNVCAGISGYLCGRINAYMKSIIPSWIPLNVIDCKKWLTKACQLNPWFHSSQHLQFAEPSMQIPEAKESIKYQNRMLLYENNYLRCINNLLTEISEEKNN